MRSASRMVPYSHGIAMSPWLAVIIRCVRALNRQAALLPCYRVTRPWRSTKIQQILTLCLSGLFSRASDRMMSLVKQSRDARSVCQYEGPIPANSHNSHNSRQRPWNGVAAHKIAPPERSDIAVCRSARLACASPNDNNDMAFSQPRFADAASFHPVTHRVGWKNMGANQSIFPANGASKRSTNRS